LNIRNIDTYVSQIWDWSFLNDCFKQTKIRVTDIDGMVESDGHFLMIETKMPDEPIPLGQDIMFEHFVSSGQNQVLIIWGYRNNPVQAQFWGKNPFAVNEKGIKAIVARWFEYADTHGRG